MKFIVLTAPAAIEDTKAGYNYYEGLKVGLGETFLQILEE